MATNVTAVVPTVDSSGAVTALAVSGTSDRPRIRLELPAVLVSAVDEPDAAESWSVTFEQGTDFVAGDLSCDDVLDVNVSWRTVNDVGWHQEDGFPTTFRVDCNQCAITVTGLDGVPAPGGEGMSELIVRGTAAVCTDVSVSVVQFGAAGVTTSAPVVGGEWNARFVAGTPEVGTALKAYQCDEVYEVRASCSTDRSCSGSADLPLICVSPCPPFADVEVTNAATGFQVVNPAVTDLQCAPPGDYTLTVTSPPESEVNSYTWYRNQDVNDLVGSARSLPVTVGAEENTMYTVSVDRIDDCSPARTVTFSCGDPGSERPPLLRCPTLDGIDVDGCTPGEVTLTAYGQNLDQALEFQWGYGDGTGENAGVTVTHVYDGSQARTVSVTVRRPAGCPAPNPRITEEVVPCSIGPDPGRGESSWCEFLRNAGVILIAIGFVLAMIGLTAQVFLPGLATILCYIGIGTLFAGVVCIALWLWWCAADAACRTLQSVIQVIEAMAILTIIFGLLGLAFDPVCGGLLFANGALLGVINTELFKIFSVRRCVWEPGPFDFFLPPPRP